MYVVKTTVLVFYRIFLRINSSLMIPDLLNNLKANVKSPEILIRIRISRLFFSCRWPGSNRHGYFYPQDFKSWASANSATPAFFYKIKMVPRGLEPRTDRL